jgi:hypothetical protein
MNSLRIPLAAALLGLPAALLAHGLVFGGEHAVGGALQSAALSAGVLVLLVAAALHSRTAAQGTIMASRLRSRRPGAVPLFVFSAVWFALLEACESPHHLPIAVIAAALCLACMAVRGVLGPLGRAIALASIAIAGAVAIRPARSCPIVPRRHPSPQPVRALAHAARIFSRPPPLFS